MATNDHRAAEARLRKLALAYEGAVEEFPWGERVVKVAKKIFVFINLVAGELSVTVKLPHSREMALTLPFATPTGYGLGKSGWVSTRFGRTDNVPEELLGEWIDESYRAIAPKRLVKSLDAAAEPVAAKRAKKPNAATTKRPRTPPRKRRA